MNDPKCKKCHGKGSFSIPCPDGREGCCVLHTQVCDCELRVEAKKPYTIDDIKRLVPEVAIYSDLIETDMFKALLTTRRQLEIAREALEPFAKFGKKLDGRRGTPKEGDWYSLDSGSENEAVLTIEHFKLAIEAIKKEQQ